MTLSELLNLKYFQKFKSTLYSIRMVSQRMKIGIFASIGIFSILLGVATIYVYEINPVDIIKYRFQHEDIPLGEYPHTSNCPMYSVYVHTMSSLCMLMGIVALRFTKSIYKGKHIFGYNTWLIILWTILSAVHILASFTFAFRNAYPESDASLGEAITSENFILYRTRGCSQYLLDHHMASFISCFIVLSVPSFIIIYMYLSAFVKYFICCKDCQEE